MTSLAAVKTALTKIEYGHWHRDPPTGNVTDSHDGRALWVHDGSVPGGDAGSNNTPSTATALTYTGSLGYQSITHPRGGCHLVECHQRPSSKTTALGTGLAVGGTLLFDRLSHTGGLSGTVTTAQTTNLPTAALTRYTTGEGVRAAMQIYTTVGPTDFTTSCSYTNQAGTAGRTGQISRALGTPGSGSLGIFTLQSGDTGVRSVESVTLSASTGTAGNFGVVLLKPLCVIPPAQYSDVSTIFGWNNEILDEAFLDILVPGHGGSGTSMPGYTFGFTTAL